MQNVNERGESRRMGVRRVGVVRREMQLRLKPEENPARVLYAEELPEIIRQ